MPDELSVPLRDGITVRIAGLPNDLSSEEADRLARVIKAFAPNYHHKAGKAGGKARAEKLTPERRSEIARNAANARYGRKQD